MVLQNNKHKRTLQQRQNKKKKMKLKKKKEKQDARNLIRRCYIILRVGWNGMETEFRNFVARSWERTRCLVSTTIFYDRETIDKDNNTEIEIVNFLLFSPSIKILEDRDPRRFYLFVRDSVRVMLIIEAQRNISFFCIDLHGEFSCTIRLAFQALNNNRSEIFIQKKKKKNPRFKNYTMKRKFFEIGKSKKRIVEGIFPSKSESLNRIIVNRKVWGQGWECASFSSSFCVYSLGGKAR